MQGRLGGDDVGGRSEPVEDVADGALGGGAGVAQGVRDVLADLLDQFGAAVGGEEGACGVEAGQVVLDEGGL